MAKTGAVTLPSELRRVLMLCRPLLPCEAAGHTPQPSPDPETLCHDMAQYLLFLQRMHCLEPTFHLHHGRWLPARLLPDLNRSLLYPEAATQVDGAHIHTHRLRLLAFWASAAALHVQGRLTAAGRQWLDLPTAAKVQLLWRAHLAADQSLRAGFRLPDAELGPPWTETLATALSVLGQEPFTPSLLTARLLASDKLSSAFWAAHHVTLGDVEEIVCHLLEGPLLAVGLVERLPTGQLRYGRTAAAHAPAPTSAALTTATTGWHACDDGWQLTLSTQHQAWSAVADLCLFADPMGCQSGLPYDAHTYRINEATLRRAILCGLPATQLIHAAETLGAPLPAAAITLVHALVDALGEPRFALAALVRTQTREQMAALMQTDLRKSVVEILSGTVAILDGKNLHGHDEKRVTERPATRDRDAAAQLTAGRH